MIELIVFAFVATVMTFFLWRNSKVLEFKRKVLELDQSKRSFDLMDDSTWNTYTDKLPSYGEMLYKFWKPIKLKTYFTQEEIADLLNCDNPKT